MPKIPFWVFIVLACVYFSAIRVDVMDIDASQYAEMSREMTQSHSYLQLYDRGVEYLDKPPFLFWVSSASISIFGVNNFGYKLPSILFALWALYALYRLTRLLYDDDTARVAALILGCCQGMFLMTNDIRCDTILMSWVVTALWAIKECEQRRRWQYVLLGTLAIACGMMTKGPIALMVPVFCFGTDWVLKRKWKHIFSAYHIFDLLLILIFLVPMSIGLYQQFDLHPDKIVNGQTGVSGLRFFYWTQSFGRITGESIWNNGAGIDFLMLNMLWSFLPWIFLLIIALVLNVGTLIKQKLRLQEGQEWISTGGFILSYIALGSSHYQLPHYIFVAFPLAAIMVAKLLSDVFNGGYPRLSRFVKPMQSVISALLLVAALLTAAFVFPDKLWIAIWVITTLCWLFIAFNKRLGNKMLWLSACAIVAANVMLTNHFYYSLAQYQSGSVTGRYIREQHIVPAKVKVYKIKTSAVASSFYANGLITEIHSVANIGSDVQYLLTSKEGLDSLQANSRNYDVLLSLKDYKISELTPDFLNPLARHKVLYDNYFVQLSLKGCFK